MAKTLESFRSQHFHKSDVDSKKEIAVIGMACRFPGSETPEQFWAALTDGKSSISQSPRFARVGGYLDDIDLFDPDYFSIPSQDAAGIDPLTRLVLLQIPKLLANAGYTAQDIKGKSVHGTGTNLGDPIEFQALSAAFNTFSSKKNFCALGAVKGLIGHSFAASGVVGFIKALLVLRHNVIPATRVMGAVNEDIDIANSAFYFPKSESILSCNRVAVSSFGFSGTNVHVVLEKILQKGPPPSLKRSTFAKKERFWPKVSLTTILEKVYNNQVMPTEEEISFILSRC